MKITELAYQENTELMVLDYGRLSVSLVPKAEELKQAALEKSAVVCQVENSAEQEIAVAAQLALDNLIRLTEKTRKQIKQPVIDLGRKIDAQAETFVQRLHVERTRVSKLIGDFQQLELAKVRAAEAALKLQAESLERKRQEELHNSTSLEEMDEIQERFNERSAELANMPVPVAAKAECQTVKNDWDIVVNDPYQLAKYHYECVTITPKIGEIKQLLTRGIKVHGITATPIIKVGTRPTGLPKFIEV